MAKKNDQSDEIEQADTIMIDEIKKLKKINPEIADKDTDDLLVEFKEKYLSIEEKKHPDMDIVTLYRRAYKKFKNKNLRQIVSGAVVVEGIIIDAKGKKPIDMIRKRRATALAIAKKDEEKAIVKNYIAYDPETMEPILDEYGEYIPTEHREFSERTDENGNPYPIKGFKKALPRTKWEATYLGYLSVDGKKPKMIRVKFTKKNAKPDENGKHCLDVPINTPVRFRAFESEFEKNTIYGFDTPFEPIKTSYPELWELYSTTDVFEDNIITMADIPEWLSNEGRKFGAFAVMELSVITKMPKNDNGNYMMKVTDDSLGFGSNVDYMFGTLLVNEEFEDVVESFAEDTSLVVLCTIMQDFKKDDDGNTVLDDEGMGILDSPLILASNIVIHPDYHEKPRNVKKASSEDITELKKATKTNSKKKKSKVVIPDDDDDDYDEIEIPDGVEFDE